MRIFLFHLCIFYCGILLSQPPKPGELYKKIENYYRQNPDRLEFVRNVHKNVLRYDTVINFFAFQPLPPKGFFLFHVDSGFTITGGMLLSEKYYTINSNSPEKILFKKKDLKGSLLYRLWDIPARHSTNYLKLLTRFGPVISINQKVDKYIAVTQKSILEIDTLSFRITKLTEVAFYKGKVQYNEFHYVRLPDSIEKSIKEQVAFLTEAAKDLPVTTFKEMEKRKAPPENFEGKTFAFKNLVSYNKGQLDSVMKGKYVILDFFYQACLPCHKMTGYILDWLPSVDSSKIVLIGVNPWDPEPSMKLYAQHHGINYPIILGPRAKEIAKKYVTGGYPTLLLLGPDGIIQNIHTGMSKSFLTKAEKIISQ